MKKNSEIQTEPDEPDAGQRGGARSGAGRPKGSMSKRSVEAIEAVRAKYPDWSPLQLLAQVANDDNQEMAVRIDAAKAAAPFFHPRLKPVEIDPESALEFERQLAEIRAHAIGKALPFDGFVERFKRARERAAAAETTELDELRALKHSLVTAKVVMDSEPASSTIMSPAEESDEPEEPDEPVVIGRGSSKPPPPPEHPVNPSRPVAQPSGKEDWVKPRDVQAAQSGILDWSTVQFPPKPLMDQAYDPYRND
ncbi:hypothetical protein [Mesorhizobium sp. GR13]|uniref:hypothetical protein n=1 Tax=Mesorhizobium sp. GR13 TaxID=2562308 RepID=UPI0010C08826|nr:hypothetical protein [Mesorhizobium sp. GR13]